MIPLANSLVSAARCQRSGVSGLEAAVWCQRSGVSGLANSHRPTATLHLPLFLLLPNGIFVRHMHLSSLLHQRRSKLSGWKVLVLVNWGLKFPRHEC